MLFRQTSTHKPGLYYIRMNKLSLSDFVVKRNSGLCILVAFTLILVSLMYLVNIPLYTEQVFSLKESVVEKVEFEGMKVFVDHDINHLFETAELSLEIDKVDTRVNDKLSIIYTRTITDGALSKIDI